jgi:hypothetical protein
MCWFAMSPNDDLKQAEVADSQNPLLLSRCGARFSI